MHVIWVGHETAVTMYVICVCSNKCNAPLVDKEYKTADRFFCTHFTGTPSDNNTSWSTLSSSLQLHPIGNYYKIIIHVPEQLQILNPFTFPHVVQQIFVSMNTTFIAERRSANIRWVFITWPSSVQHWDSNLIIRQIDWPGTWTCIKRLEGVRLETDSSSKF